MKDKLRRLRSEMFELHKFEAANLLTQAISHIEQLEKAATGDIFLESVETSCYYKDPLFKIKPEDE